MEPILELATRITSHIWFLHELFPGEERLDYILAVRLVERKIKPTSYSEARRLLDLADQHFEWTASEYFWGYGEPGKRGTSYWPPDEAASQCRRPSHAPPPQTPPPRTPPSQISLTSMYDSYKSRRRDQIRSDAQNNWDQLRKKEEEALKEIGRRVEALEQHFKVGHVPDDMKVLKKDLTREELYEQVVALLLKSTIRQRVALADRFVPESFFIEQAIEERLPPKGRPAREQLLARWDFAEDNRDEKRAFLLNPPCLRGLCASLGVAIPFSMVLRDELDEIARSRLVRLHSISVLGDDLSHFSGTSGVKLPLTSAQRQAFDSNLFGLALSGGGIRSATFALGVLQGMADRNILPYIDVLSTVSGGGYIGSWLISWIKRRGSVGSVQKSMCGNATNFRCAKQPHGNPLSGKNVDPESDHVRPIRLLRQYARYLAPEAGLFEADTWTILSTWLRNTLLNFLILIALFGAVLLIPRIAAFLLAHSHRLVWPLSNWWGFLAAWLIGGSALWAACYLVNKHNLATFGPYHVSGEVRTRGYGDAKVVTRIFPLLVLGAFAQVALMWYADDLHLNPVTGALAFGCVILVALPIVGLNSSWQSNTTRMIIPFGPIILAVISSMVTGVFLMYGLYQLVPFIRVNTERGIWVAAGVGVPLMLLSMAVIVVMFIGVLGSELTDDQREWWSRVGAWIGLTVCGWLGLCAICFYAPLWTVMLGEKIAAAGIGWTAITAWGAKLAYSPKSGRNGADSTQSWMNGALLNIAPAVFVIGLLSAVSFALFWGVGEMMTHASFLDRSSMHQLCCSGAEFSIQRMVDNYWPLMFPGSLAPSILALVLGGISFFLAWRVDINEFSMHNFYKNRLVRCYLGATRARAHRRPNAFTAFDPEDDIRLFRFRYTDKSQPGDMRIDCQPSYAGPYPIINTALNVTQGEDLGLQERKAESFVFTPLWSGFDFSRRQATVKKTALAEYGFRRTREFGQPANNGVFLGTAMAISGAAFNSNAGFHTSPSLAFLLTVFGVRLGWWAGNPRQITWREPSPALGLTYLVKELTAHTDTSSDFVLLSDGGHFENMGLYELVRRRCRFIIVVDAEEDQQFKLEGIGGAVRKCRVDFGVVIDLNLEALQPLGDPAVSKLHYTLGTVRYPGEWECAQLLYIKSSVTGDEPVDVIEFRKEHEEFPHTSTTDQFFDESHFESYRALGQHVAQGIFTQDLAETPVADPAQEVRLMFQHIEEKWKHKLAVGENK
jgi:hypothetical protein